MLPVLVAALALASTPAPTTSPPEQRYLVARDAATARFSKGEGPLEAEGQAMEDLRRRLRDVVGPVKLPNLTGEGELAYEGFWGVGSTPGVADGLIYQWSGATLFVTTKSLLTGVEAGPTAASQNLALEALVSRTVLGGHAGFTSFAELPVRFGPATRRGRAVIGQVAQDDGAWPPNYLVAAMDIGQRVFLVAAPLEPPVAQVDACAERFNAVRRKASEDAAASSRYHEEAIAEYRRCLGPGLARQSSFKAALGRAQGLVDQLEASHRSAPRAAR